MQQESESKSLKDKYKYNLYWVMSCKFAPPTGGFGLQTPTTATTFGMSTPTAAATTTTPTTVMGSRPDSSITKQFSARLVVIVYFVKED